MDWTGGSRRRFAPGKNNTIVQKQKAHFAKARAGLLSASGSQHSVNHGVSSAKVSFRRRRGAGFDYYAPSGNVARARRPAGRAYRVPDEMAVRLPSSHWRQQILAENVHRARRSRASKISISSDRRSSSIAAGQSELNKMRERSIDSTAQSAQDLGDDNSLRRKRRELLARRDWLGLNVNRPFHMRFASAHDKDRIGKRRKITSPVSRKGLPAAKRRLTPLFEGQADLDYMVSGGLSDDSVQIKIGTDALASQTQASHALRSLGNTSMRPPSTDFDSLSEESMLLGENGDAFEMLRTNPEHGTQSEPDLTQGGHSVAERKYGQTGHAEHSIRSGSVEIASARRPNMHPELIGVNYDNSRSLGPASMLSLSEGVAQHNMWLEHGFNADVLPCDDQSSRETHHSDSLSARSLIVEKTISDERHDETDDEDIWQRLLDLRRDTSSHQSLAALKSSSAHVTDSDSDVRPDLKAFLLGCSEQTSAVSSPLGAGTQQANIRSNEATKADYGSSSSGVGSPSASLARVMKLSRMPTAPSKHQQEEEDDNALWRQFVIGSEQDSDSESLQLLDVNGDRGYNHRSQTHEVSESSAFIVSGLGTSQISTKGGSLRHIADSSSEYPRKQAKQNATASSYEVLDMLSSTLAERSGSTEKDMDIVNEASERLTRQQPRLNIHASTTRAAKKPHTRGSHSYRRQPTSPRIRAPLIGNPQRSAAKPSRSIYDLGDSDGFSLP